MTIKIEKIEKIMRNINILRNSLQTIKEFIIILDMRCEQLEKEIKKEDGEV